MTISDSSRAAATVLSALRGICLLSLLTASCAVREPYPPRPTPSPPIPARIQPAGPPEAAEPAPSPEPPPPQPPPPAETAPRTPPPKPEKQRVAAVPPNLAGLAWIKKNPFLTRGDLALLLAALTRIPVEHEAEVPIMTDIFTHPARESIIAVVRSGFLDAFPNHQFKPDALISRAEVADSLSRLLVRSEVGGRADYPEVVFPDIPPASPYYLPSKRAVALRIMDLGPDGSFRPTAPVTGAEGWEIILRLEAVLAGRKG